MIRNLAIAIVTFLCRRFNIALVAEARLGNGQDAISRGNRWEQFYQEEGGIKDMIASLRHDYFLKVGQLHPGETQKLLALGMADKIALEIERKVQTVIETGRIRANDKAHTNKIAAIR